MPQTPDQRPFAVAVERFRENLGRLTPREREILDRMLSADSVKETAMQLGMAPSTTRNHRSRVLQKLMAHDTPDLVRIAAGAGRLPPLRGK